ncbi:MAG TPA: tetratricopeptide repeat protein [Galbitalea sp.]|jgi:tetratricopeptide (TPR) repeat protein
MTTDDWAKRVATLWDISDELGDNILLERMDALVAERPATDARAAYEAGSVRDSIGLEAEAAPHYQRALELGADGSLGESLTTQLRIQYASTLRNLGRYDEGLALLDAIPADDELADAAAAFRALILSSAGELPAALSLALATLATHLPRYQRSVLAYAHELPVRLANGE